MICVSSNEVYILNPRLDIRTARTFSPRTRICIFGPYKSNASRDGTKLAVRATNRQGEFVDNVQNLSHFQDCRLPLN